MGPHIFFKCCIKLTCPLNCNKTQLQARAAKSTVETVLDKRIGSLKACSSDSSRKWLSISGSSHQDSRQCRPDQHRHRHELTAVYQSTPQHCQCTIHAERQLNLCQWFVVRGCWSQCSSSQASVAEAALYVEWHISGGMCWPRGHVRLCVVHLDNTAAGCIHVSQPCWVRRLRGPVNQQHSALSICLFVYLIHSQLHKIHRVPARQTTVL